MARACTRGSKHGYQTNGKKIAKVGNNRWGSRGCIKCDECRQRKTKCRYDTNNPEEPCRHCKKRKANCVKTFPQSTKSSASDYSLSPSPSENSSSAPSRSPRSSNEFPANDIDLPRRDLFNAPTSVMLDRSADYARQIERTYTHWPPERIIPIVRDSIEQGAFGDLSNILFPSRPPMPLSPQRQVSHQPIVSPPFTPFVGAVQQYTQHIQSPSRVYSVNPATLSMPPLTPMQPYNYTDALQREDSQHSNIESDSTVAPELERHMPAFQYVNVPSTRGLRDDQREDQHEFASMPTTYNVDLYSGYGN